MQGLNRRHAIVGLATLSAASQIRAQGKCSATGMTIDEALAAWADEKRAADMDKNSFLMTIQRVSKAAFMGKDKDGKEVEAIGVLGVLSVNGIPLGDVLENDALRIAAGTYKGVMRYVSSKNFVQGPLGAMGETGDFLLEVSGVKGRGDLLLHTGTKPWHSRGCILAGAAKKSVVDGKTKVTLVADTTLQKVRQKFYGADVPNACPNLTIRVSIAEIA